MELDNGDRYSGSFVDDCMHGLGKYESKVGNTYEGEFVNDEISGQGI